MNSFQELPLETSTRCFATGRLIDKGEEVVIFPIFQMKGYVPTTVITGRDEHGLITEDVRHPSEFMHPHSLWIPLGCALRGAYDGQGKFALTKSDFNRTQLLELYSELAKTACITPAGSNPYREKEFTLPSVDTLKELAKVSENPAETPDLESMMHCFFNMLQDAVSANRVFISTRHSTTFRYGYSSLMKFAVASDLAVTAAGPVIQESARLGPSPVGVSALGAYQKLTLTIKQWRVDALRGSVSRDLSSLRTRLGEAFSQPRNWPAGQFTDAIPRESLTLIEDTTKLEYVVKEIVGYFKNVHASLFSLSEFTEMVSLEKMLITYMVNEILTAKISDGESSLSKEFMAKSESLLAISDFLLMVRKAAILFCPLVQIPSKTAKDINRVYETWLRHSR